MVFGVLRCFVVEVSEVFIFFFLVMMCVEFGFFCVVWYLFWWVGGIGWKLTELLCFLS